MHSVDTHLLRTLKKTLGIALFFMLLELIGGYYAGSLALMSDALHMLTDSASLGISLLAARLAHIPTKTSGKMSYGYHRAEVLGALVNALSLGVICFFLIQEALQRLYHPTVVEGGIVFGIAWGGLIANILMLRLLHPVQDKSLNTKAAYLHVLGDLLGSIGVLVGGLTVWITGWNAIDPLLTLVFALVLIYNAGKITLQSLAILMESSPKAIDIKALEEYLQAFPGVEKVDHLHVWALSSQKNALTVHLISSRPQELLPKISSALKAKYPIHYLTIQLEEPPSTLSYLN